MSKSKRMTPKTFAPHLLVALGELTEYEANVSVPMEETFKPVCARMGIEEDYGGETAGGYKFTHRNIGLAFRQHVRGKGLGDSPKKGHWMLTQQGVDEARQIAGVAAPEVEDDDHDETEEMPAAARADATAEDNDEDDGADVLNLPVRHPYSDDPYIRSLAIASVPCFGAWSKRSDACSGCPIASDCRAQVGARKAEMAAELEAEEAARIAKEKADAERDAKKAQSVGELIESAAREEGSSQAGKKGKFKPAAGQEFADATATRGSVCLQCGEKIPKGEPVKWCSDEGIFHVGCFDEE